MPESPNPSTIDTVVAQKFAHIDADAAKQKDIVTFIARIVDSRRNDLEPFRPQDTQEPVQITNGLFETVKSHLDSIERDVTASFGLIRRVNLPENNPSLFQDPSFALGWTKLVPLNESRPIDDGTYVFRTTHTEAGIEAVNQYRRVRGLETTAQEQGERNREAFWAPVRERNSK